MLSRRLTFAFIATVVLLLTSCSVSRKASSSQLRVKSEELKVADTRDSVIVTLCDTLRESTTVTVSLSEAGDTLRVSTVTERAIISSRDRSQTRVRSEKMKVEADTVSIESQTDKTVAAVGPNTEIDGQGNIKHQPAYIRLIRWATLLIVAIAALIIVIRVRKRF